MFGQFLVSLGLVSPDEVVDALNRQRLEQPLLGRIALKGKYLTMKQVFHVLNLQADRAVRQDSAAKEILFGDIAVSLGYMTPEQLEEILRIQRSSRQKIGEMLVTMGALTPEKLDEALSLYKSE